MPRSLIVSALFFSIAGSAPLMAEPADAPPPMEDLQKLFNDHQWQPLLQGIARATASKTSAASYDPYLINLMKGESNLQLKQTVPAISAFNEAVKVAATDANKAAIPAATVALIKHSQQFVYKRKSPTTQPSEPTTIDLLDWSQRVAGFAALAADEALALQPKATAAASATSIRPTIELVKSLDDLRVAELASVAATPQLDALVAPLVTHANELSEKAISADKAKVDAIEKSANENVEVESHGYGGTRGYYGHARKRGLMGTDTQALNSIVSDSQQIASGDKQLAAAMGASGKPLEQAATDADGVATKAKAVLDTNFNAVDNSNTNGNNGSGSGTGGAAGGTPPNRSNGQH